MKINTKKRLLALLLSFVFILNSLNGTALWGSLFGRSSFAAASDYSVNFSWITTDLSEVPIDKDGHEGSVTVDGDTTTVRDSSGSIIREFTVDSTGAVMSLKEYESEGVVLRTAFTFSHSGAAIQPGDLSFTITAMSDLIRGAEITKLLDDQDANVTGTWEVDDSQKTADGKKMYVFTNRVPIYDNLETTFTWNFNSRDAIDGKSIHLTTECTVRETKTDPETGEETKVSVKLDPNDIDFTYNSVHDDNQVKIVCQNLTELDTNNLNTQYNWRSYYTMLGLEGLHELNAENNRLSTDDLYTPVDIMQDRDEQAEHRNARGIKTSDYFIEVDPSSVAEFGGIQNIMIVDAGGNRVELGNYTVNGESMYGFYAFRDRGDYKAGESYGNYYRIGVLNSAITSNDKQLKLNSHYYVTYNDSNTVVEYEDSAAHTVSRETPQGSKPGGVFYKHNYYEINRTKKESDGVTYYDHAKHFSTSNQLLYDSVFGESGKTVTYYLYADSNQLKDDDTVVPYDLVYEDGAPWIKNYFAEGDTEHDVSNVDSINETGRVLAASEYDFSRIKIRKLVDGNTVGPVLDDNGQVVTDKDGNIVYMEEKGFQAVIYGKNEGGSWEIIRNDLWTTADQEIFLDPGIDYVRIVVKDLSIRASLYAEVDINYTVDSEMQDSVVIDNIHNYVEDGGSKHRYEDTNKGTKLVNYFNRKQFRVSDDQDFTEDIVYDTVEGTGHYETTHSNTWLRESTTTLDSYTKIDSFINHPSETDENGIRTGAYFFTKITATGTIQSDTEKGMHHFVIYSELPDGLVPGEDWLEQLKASMNFSATVQGTGEILSAQDMFDRGAVSIVYDEENGVISVDFDLVGYSIKMDNLTSCTFSYPANISLAKVKAGGKTLNDYTANTYVTVLDDNVKLAAAERKSLTYYELSETMAVKSSDTSTLRATGSNKQSYSEKHVSSYYNDWLYEFSTEVDGSNTHHLDEDEGRMTSEYTYELDYSRVIVSATTESVNDPLFVDILEGLDGCAWKGHFDSLELCKSDFPADYTPEVYYILNTDAHVTEAPEAAAHDYTLENATLMEALHQFTTFGEVVEGHEAELLNCYNTLKNEITATPSTEGETNSYGWKKADKTDLGDRLSYTVAGSDNADNIYAIAVLFNGSHEIVDGQLNLKAYVNMSAGELSNTGEINNNRATYNENFVFATKSDEHDEISPLFSEGNKTLVVLRHSVELEKVSSKTERRLSGAEFTITYYDASSGEYVPVQYYPSSTSDSTLPMENLPVDLSGILKLNLAPGIYYYQETKAPNGFVLDDSRYRFRVVADSDSVFHYTVGLETSTEAALQYFVVNSAEKNNPAFAYIYDGKEAVDTNRNFYVYEVNGGVVDTSPLTEKFTFDDSSKTYVYNGANGTATAINCQSDGQVKLSLLPAGLYFFGTSSSDENGYYFSVADNSEIALSVMKQSLMGGNSIGFKVYRQLGDEVSANDEKCFFSGSDGVYTLTSDTAAPDSISPASDGSISVSGFDSASKYYFVLDDAPEGYKTTEKPIYYIDGPVSTTAALVAVEQLNKTKRIVVEDDPVETAAAAFKKIDGTVIKGEEAEGYGDALNDAVYNMYLVENDGSSTRLYFSEATAIGSSETQYFYLGSSGGANGTAELVSGKHGTDGLFKVKGLPYGTYYLEEITAPKGFQLSSKRQYFVVMASTIDAEYNLIFKDEEGNDTGTLLLEDDEVLSKIILAKADYANPENYLGNAAHYIFRMQKKPEGSELTDEEYLAAAKDASLSSLGNIESDSFKSYWGEPVDQIYTSTDGTAEKSGLPFGTYLLMENIPPLGYQWNNDLSKWETWSYKDETHTPDTQVIVINKESVSANSTTTSVEYTDENGDTAYRDEVTYHAFYAKQLDERKTGEARLTKRNAEEVGLPSAIFALYKVNLTVSEKAAVLGITVAEVEAMTASQLQTALDKVELKVSDIDINDHYDASNGKPLVSGGKEIDTAINKSLKTDANGETITSSGLEWGIYYYYEVKAPVGYQADAAPHVFAVNSGSVDTLIEIDATDDKTYGEVWLYKQDKDSLAGSAKNRHQKLFGAGFSLYTNSNEPVHAVPMLRLTVDGTEKTFLVRSVEVIDRTHIKYTLSDGSSVTAEYEDNSSGADIENDEKVSSVSGDESFTSLHPGEINVSRFRLAYYVVSADGSLIYDDNIKRYRETDASESSCITPDYYTANNGGQLNVRGLDWGSYYFRETIAPAGYGLADDVVFTVNAYNCDSQFVACEDPKAQAMIIIDKQIPSAEYFDAYGDPTFMFKIYGLAEQSGDAAAIYNDGTTDYMKNGTEYTLAIHLSDPETSGTAITNVPVGKYLIEEIPVSRYVCKGLELVTDGSNPTSASVSSDASKYAINNGLADYPWTAFCDLSGGSPGDMLKFHVKYTNEIERYDSFSDVTFADNRVPEREYITALKTVYSEIVPVYSGTEETYTYEIDLAAAMANGDFEGVLTYNIGATKEITAEDLKDIIFKNTGSAPPVTAVTFTDGVLRVTTTDPATLAGSAISLDLGYSNVDPFTVYDLDNTNMISGRLVLSFGDIMASRNKKVIYKNDVSNKSYFPGDATLDSERRDSSVAVIYSKTGEGSTAVISSTMQNPVQTKNLIMADSNYTFECWYMIDSDGRPVLDKEGNVIKFADESEITAYIYDGTWPAYLKAGTAESLLPDGTVSPAEVGNVNTFTFQAQVKENTLPKAKLAHGKQVRATINFLVESKLNNNNHSYNIKNSSENVDSSYIKRLVRSDISPEEAGKTLYLAPVSASGLIQNQFFRNGVDTDKVYTAISVSYPGSDGTTVFPGYREGYTDEDYPYVIYAWSDDEGTVYWYTDEPSGKIMLNENCSYMFSNCSKISDDFAQTGFDHMKAELVTNMSYMFGNTRDYYNITGLNLDSWNTPNVTDMSHMFYNQRALRTISWEGMDTGNVKTIAQMLDCVGLYNIDFMTGLNMDKIENMNYFINPLNGSTLGSDSNMLNVVESWSGLSSLTNAKNAFKNCYVKSHSFTTKDQVIHNVDGNGTIDGLTG